MPLVRDRTAMFTARRLEARYTSEEYREEYAQYRENMDALDPDHDATWLDQRLLPDPDRVRIRAYSTHSTHKSLSALRQGSMMHVYDQDFERLVADNFTEAFLAHTSTSPNYQIIASLDLARRQLELEGYEKVSATYEMAFTFRKAIATDPLLSRYFSVLDPADLVPEEFRPSGFSTYDDWSAENWARAIHAYENDEFVIDATRVTLYLADAGFNGAEFRDDILMDQHGIQVNKTSINTVLLIFTIGVTWSSLSALLDALRRIAADLDTRMAQASEADRRLFERRRTGLTADLPDLPDFSEFHPAFRPNAETPNGDMRAAYFLNYGDGVRDYVPLDEARERAASGEVLVSSSFVVPYPPGFPVLVPGQIISTEIIDFMQKLDVDEVHGYRSALGLSVFTDEALRSVSGASRS
jgi:arginine decarboxylase